MQFALSAVVALLAASPVSAAIVTEVVHVTQYVYQDVNVFVDQNGVPVTTVSSLVSTSEIAGAPTPSTPANPDTLQHSHADHPTSYASIDNNYQYQAPTTESDSPAAAPTTTVAPVAVTTSSPAPAPPAETTSAAAPAETTPAAAPVETTTSEPAPAPVTTSSSAPAATQTEGSGSGSSGSGETYTGQATYYTPGLGACGVTNTASDFIAALNVDQFNSFGSMSNGNPVCGKKATITRNGKSVTVTITDKCPGCKYGDLDLSPAAFDAIASEAEGRVDISWSFDS